VAVIICRILPWHLSRGTRETTQDLSRDNKRSGRDINPERPKCSHDWYNLCTTASFGLGITLPYTEVGDINEVMKLKRVI